MSRKTYGAGLIATAATFAFTVFGAEGSGAAAELTGAAAELNSASVQIAAESASETMAGTKAETLRFVANEVVQPLPEPMFDPDEGINSAINAEVGARAASSLRELVSSIPLHSEAPQDLHCLAQAVYFESRGEPLAGQLAVARVIINRAESRAFPDSYCSVVKQRAQFSFVKSGRIPAVRQASEAWRRAQAIARIAEEELWESQAQDALYFHAVHVKPRWAAKKLARATIDRHIFYR